jgi:hypothetical protein
MKNVRQLTSKEVIFVGGETPSIYQHTGGLLILDASNCPDFGYETFRAHTESSLGGLPQFHWRLHQVPLGLDLPYWDEDENFNFDRHMRRIAVPSPGDNAALAELVGYLYNKHMDRGAALWEAWFIEGLADGRFAVFHKVHHCLMDGKGAPGCWSTCLKRNRGRHGRRSHLILLKPGLVISRNRGDIQSLRPGGYPACRRRQAWKSMESSCRSSGNGSGT